MSINHLKSVPVAAGTSPLPTKQFTVPAGNAPLWFYCSQVGHCGQGMVFAINPPADPAPNSFSAFKAAAIAQNGTSSVYDRFYNGIVDNPCYDSGFIHHPLLPHSGRPQPLQSRSRARLTQQHTQAMLAHLVRIFCSLIPYRVSFQAPASTHSCRRPHGPQDHCRCQRTSCIQPPE